MTFIGIVLLFLIFGIGANVKGLRSEAVRTRQLSLIAVILLSITFLSLAGYLILYVSGFKKIGG